MRKFTLIVLCLLINYSIQAQRKVSSYLSLQYNKTIYDITSGNNPSAIGSGLEVFFNITSKFKPVIDMTVHVYLEDDKVLRITSLGEPIKDVGSMINIFAGGSFHPVSNAFVSIVAGPSFINGISFGIKPSLGYYFGNRQKIIGKISFINIFNRNTDSEIKQDFGTLSFTIGFKLF